MCATSTKAENPEEELDPMGVQPDAVSAPEGKQAHGGAMVVKKTLCDNIHRQIQ